MSQLSNDPDESTKSERSESGAPPCCSSAEQASCCEPSAKAGCCGARPASADAGEAPAKCGCR